MHGNVINGVGLGLRSPHIKTILESSADVPWFELLTDNWLNASGIDGFLLDEICERYPLALHSVSMNIGGIEPLSRNYLESIRRLADRCQSKLISDHLCFSAASGKHLHDLLPLPYTQEALDHCAIRINTIQDILGCSINIENVSAYVEYEYSSMSEVEFLNAVAEQSGCGILLDINNLYVNQKNLDQDARHFIETINKNAVREIHLGGFTDKDSYYLDAHNNPVSDGVWDLYQFALEYFPTCPTLIEWDNDLPDFETLLLEKQKADHLLNTYRYEPAKKIIS